MSNTVPPKLNYLAGIAWRLLAIVGVIGLVIFLIIKLKIIVIPFLTAILVAALMYPFVTWLVRKKIHRGWAVAISLTTIILVVAAIFFVFVSQVRSTYPVLKDKFNTTAVSVQEYLVNQAGFDDSDLESLSSGATTYIQEHSSSLIAGVSLVGSTAGHILAGTLLAIFATIFLAYDGKTIWKWTVNLVPRSHRTKLNIAGEKGWRTLVDFMKSQVKVAGVDATGIGIGALLLQVPLAIPIALIVFIGSFIPVVGAVVTGSIAVVVALIFNGWVGALLMLGVVLFVQFVEGHLLQPFLVGRAVKIHPLVIVFAVAAGSLLAGIPGALFAVPIVAVLNVMINHLLSDEKQAV